MPALAFDIPPRLFPVQHRFLDLDGARIHQVDEAVATQLLLHGNPTWSFLYRKIIVALWSDSREAERQRFERQLTKHLSVLFDSASHYI